MSDYKVQLEVFEGPMDLLLYLIKKAEVDIYHIPIAKITTQYMEYLDLMKLVVPEVAGEFIVMGATLMYIKSRMLLPEDQQVTDPDAPLDEVDPRWELIRQLVEYKKFKDAAAQLQERQLLQEKLFPRQASEMALPGAGEATLDLGQVSIFDLLNAFNQVLKRIHEPDDLREIFEERFTVSDKIEFILKIMEVEERTPFTQLFDGAASRIEVIVTFLALLELIRLKKLRVEQGDPFAEIQVVRANPEAEVKPAEPAAEKAPEPNPTVAPENA
jgi:segregation and condensation protein A